MNTKRVKSWFNVDIIMVILIAICMIFLINFTTNKLNEIEISNQEALMVNHDPDNVDHEEFAKEIINFHPEACKLIEVYTEDFRPILHIQFREDQDGVPEPNLADYPELIQIFTEHDEGHTCLEIGDTTEDVYFRWSTARHNNKHYLVIVYTSRPTVENVWVISFTCYIILIMICILLVRLNIKAHAEKIRTYEYLSTHM